MRIAIDASRTTVARVTGTEHYARELIRALLPHLPGATLYFRDDPAETYPVDAQRRVLPARRVWTHTAFTAALWRDRPQLTFVPAHTLPLIFPGRAVVTVHDLGYKLFPAAHPAWPRMYLEASTRWSVTRATIIFADSQATARDLTRYYNVPSGRIRVVYPGVDAPPINAVYVRAKYNLPGRYLLFLGTLQPRKNIGTLAEAYESIRARHPDVGLVLAGGKGWKYDPAWAKHAVLPGYIDEADKGALYANAEALVFPSLYEGFGFPVLEAMACGTPVVCSDTSSLPELAGDAALTVDPTDADALADAVCRVLEDDDLRACMIERGHEQAATFTWARAAEQALAGFEAALA